jgi:polar amino acid transport system substrate-binding protein
MEVRDMRRFDRRRVLVLGAAAVGTAGLGPWLAGCGDDTASGGDPWDALRRGKRIRVGIFNQAPYGYLTPDGTVGGESVDTLRAVMRTYGINELEPSVVEFNALVPGLAAGRFDAICAGLYINPQRCSEVAFGMPHLKMGETFLVKKGNPRNLHSYADVVANPGVKLGVNGGTAEFKYAQDAGIPSGQIVTFTDSAGLISGLKSGRVDAIGLTVGTAANTLSKGGNEDLEMAVPFESTIKGKEIAGYGAVAFQKNWSTVVARYNEGLQKLRDSGELARIMQQNKLTPAEVAPAEKTVEQLCAPT